MLGEAQISLCIQAVWSGHTVCLQNYKIPQIPTMNKYMYGQKFFLQHSLLVQLLMINMNKLNW